MSLTYLTTHAMVAITHDMLNDPAKLFILASDQLTNGLIDRMRDIHTELALITRAEGQLQTRLQEISDELRQSDQIHDRLARGMYRNLESATDLCVTDLEANAFTEARTLLFPDALSINTLSHREESGNVLKVAQQITPKVRATLEASIIHGRNLAQSFDAWVQNGEHMGKLVAERASLSGDDDDTRISAGDMRDLRTRWIRIMNVLLSTLDLVDVTESDRRRLLSNLRDAETAAIRTRTAEQNRKTRPAAATEIPAETQTPAEIQTPAETEPPCDDAPPLTVTLEDPA